MYEIRPDRAKGFITDKSIQLPRFQRKQTWDEKKNFQLCISVFKGYPIGVCTLNIETENRKQIKYLLDGRQRRNALTALYENPEIVATWAKKYLGYKYSISEYDLTEKYYAKVNDYLEADDSDDNEIETEAETQNDINESEGEVEEEESNAGVIVDSGRDGIDDLLRILLLTYKKKRHVTGFTEPFDFNDLIKISDYVDSQENEGYTLNGRKVKTFIDSYINYCGQEKEYDKWESFAEYVLSRGKLDDTKKNAGIKLEERIKRRWDDIKNRIWIVEKIDEVLTNCNIGLIEVQGFKPADSQKIFNIINSAGVQLTAAEILSAKSYWNKKISNPSTTMFDCAKELYRNMNIKIDDVYRWDVPATLLSRLGDNVIFKTMSWDSLKNKAEFEKKLTLGFKVFSGIYEKGIKKENIDHMGNNPTIDWDRQSEDTIADLKMVIKLIEDFSYFKFLKSWKTTIMELTSDAVALDFLLVLYFDWIRKDKPTGTGTKTGQFQKNSVILWDQLIYEYVNNQWKGSSDSRIARDIKDLENLGDVFSPIGQDKWTSLLKEIRDESMINGDDIKLKKVIPILYHMYCLKKKSGPSADCTIEVDHIIPQSAFMKSTIARKEVVKDNLFNLGLLPKSENVWKSDDKLNQIENDWLKSQIKEYEFIDEIDYSKYSNITNYEDLFDHIKKTAYDDTFTSVRTDLFNN